MMNTDLRTYFEHPAVIQAYRNYDEIWRRHSTFPCFNYFGINFDRKGIASVKFYFHIFHKLEKEEISRFLPATEDFYNYYPHHDFSDIITVEHSGCAFEIKFKGTMEPVRGFHFRLKPDKASYDLIGYPRLLPFDVTGLGTRPGINYEYAGGEVLRKQYYYFDKDEHKDYFARRFGHDFLRKALLIEYTEAASFAKINTWFGDSLADVPGHNLFTREENTIIQRLCDDYKVKNTAFGYYENSDVRAAYFFAINSEKPTGLNAGVTDYYANTMQLVYGK